jgi:DNA-binding response OmpR family regulator
VKNSKILFVDDEPDILDVMMDAFELHGYTNIKAARCGKEALKLLAKENFDLIISDYLMPELNGLELFKQIKKNISSKAKFLMITGLHKEELDQNEIEVISKPFIFKDLLERVEYITA